MRKSGPVSEFVGLSTPERQDVDFEFFIPQHPRVGGFSGQQRARRERYLRPVVARIERPLPFHVKLAVEYSFVFIGPEFDLSGRNRLLRTDIDNLLKFVNDLLTGVVWEDDSQIFEMRAVKRHGSESGIGLRVWILEGETGTEAGL